VELFSVKPGGREPDTIEYVKGAVPPVTVMVAEYGVPTIALLAEHGPQLRVTGDACTTMVHVVVSVLPFLSTTLVVNV
jgi:hypothetical protein